MNSVHQILQTRWLRTLSPLANRYSTNICSTRLKSPDNVRITPLRISSQLKSHFSDSKSHFSDSKSHFSDSKSHFSSSRISIKHIMGGTKPAASSLAETFRNLDLSGRPDNGHFSKIVAVLAREQSLSPSQQDWESLFSQEIFVKRPKFALQLYIHMAESEYRMPLAVFESLKDYIIATLPHSPLLLRSLDIVILAKYDGTEDRMIEIYDDIRREHKLLDAENLKNVIRGLSCTSRWPECYDLIDMYRLTASPGGKIYGWVVAAAIRHNDLEKAFTLLNDVDVLPPGVVIQQILGSENTEYLLKFLDYSEKREWIFTKEDAFAIKDRFKTKHSGVPGSLSAECGEFFTKTNHRCPHCQTSILPIRKLSSDEFKTLQRTFYERSILRGNVYLSTTPEQIQQFNEFLDRNGSFDLVIDALNTAHVTRQKATWNEKVGLLLHVLDYFAAQNKRILVLGKHVMSKKWPKTALRHIESKAKLYLTHTSASEDDLFMLKAALSHPDTQFVTKDELRDHRTLLGDDVIPLFKRWQLQNQIVFRGYSHGNRLIFRMPNTHHTAVQRSPTGWHLPYEDDELREGFKPPHSWICVKYNSTYNKDR